MTTAVFWKQTLERAVKTMAQVALTFFVLGQTVLSDVDWQVTGSAILVGGIASVLTSLVSANIGPDKDSPSVV